MKMSFTVRLVVVSIVLASLCYSQVAVADEHSPLPASQAVPEMPDTGKMEDYVAAVGIGAIITLVIEIIKAVGGIPDGQAGQWATMANVVAFAALWVAGAFGFNPTGAAVQDLLGILEQMGKLVLMIVTSPSFHNLLRDAEVFSEHC